MTFELKISTLDIRDTLCIRTRKERQISRVDPGTQEKMWCVKYNKTIKTLHIVQCDSALVNIAFQCPITHHIALNEVH